MFNFTEEQRKAAQAKYDALVASSWIPACGGTELPFTKNGKVYLYMWNSRTPEHAYYCQTSDLFLSQDESVELFGH